MAGCGAIVGHSTVWSRATDEIGYAGGVECDLLCGAQWLHVGEFAERIAELPECVLSLPKVVYGRDVASHQ
jgi:hypothetical protein